MNYHNIAFINYSHALHEAGIDLYDEEGKIIDVETINNKLDNVWDTLSDETKELLRLRADELTIYIRSCTCDCNG